MHTSHLIKGMETCEHGNNTPQNKGSDRFVPFVDPSVRWNVRRHVDGEGGRRCCLLRHSSQEVAASPAGRAAGLSIESDEGRV